MNYDQFIIRKSQGESDGGFAPNFLPDFLFDFQRAMVDWSVRKGRAALLEDCGLGKGPQELTWCENVVRHTNKPVLLLTPLAVAGQMVREGEKFGIDVRRAEPSKSSVAVHVANYDRLHHFNADDYGGVGLDESSILKNFDGATKAAVTAFMRRVPYRLLGTATAAPNDHVELGTSSEALGYLGHMDMLNRFFKNDRDNSATSRAWAIQGGGQLKWRFKGHAEQPFWRWVCSWARALRKPSDLGFDDSRFVLPPLTRREHVVTAKTLREGCLIPLAAVGMAEEREERKRTVVERCELAASLVNGTGKAAVVWGHLDDECNLLEKLIPDAIQVSGKDKDEAKEEKFAAFQSGAARVMVIKPKIGAFGLNWQHCAHVVSFASHSFEQDYQSVRRCWRFGQTQPVLAEYVTSDGEQRVLRNLQRKAELADRMFESLTRHMRDALHIERAVDYPHTEEVPSWLS